MVVQLTGDFAVSGSNPDRLNTASRPSLTVRRPAFELPTKSSCRLYYYSTGKPPPPHVRGKMFPLYRRLCRTDLFW